MVKPVRRGKILLRCHADVDSSDGRALARHPRRAAKTLLSSGILSIASRVTIAHSRIMDNAKAQIILSGDQNGRPVTNWESGQALNVQSTHWTVKHNDIRAAPRQLVVESTWSKTTWAMTRPSYAWMNNSWAGATNRIFLIPGTYQLGTLREWQARTGLDRGSMQRRSRRGRLSGTFPTSSDPVRVPHRRP